MKTLYLLLPLMILVSCGDKKVIEPAQPDPVPKLSIGDSYGGGVVVSLESSGQHGLIAATEDVGTGIKYSTITAATSLTAPVTVSNVPVGTYLTYVYVNITHPRVSELTLLLIAPNGQTLTLSANNGGNGANYDGTIFAAGSHQPSIKTGVAPFNSTYYTPEQLFSNLNSSPMNGIWKLVVKDNYSMNDGKLIRWYPEFNGTSFPWDSDSGMPWAPAGSSSAYIGTNNSNSNENTTAIVNYYGRNSSYAARYCDELTLNGYSDWYLPSKDDLNKVFEQKSILNFEAYIYWTSTEENASRAWAKGMSSGNETATTRTFNRRIRPVRKF